MKPLQERRFSLVAVSAKYCRYSPGMPDEPSHLLLGNLARGNDQITLVLPPFVIHHNDKVTLGECGDRILDRIELE